jgi:tRNA-specific 2-thiouridylase
MSGGVDSSVVAALLKEQGHDVVGITLQLYPHERTPSRKGACCAGEDVRDARRVAERIGIPHYVLAYEERFRDEVMLPFAEAYARGETPVPCVMCNRTVKFRDLLAVAKDLGAEALATGHYVRREGNALYRAADISRDQSYFLFATTREQLAHLEFPLGGMQKAETRALAQRFGLAVADKPDSQDICFVPDRDYARVVEKLKPGAAEPGEIVDLDGHVIGRHSGIIHFTVGQRRGLPGGAAEPLFVVALDPERHRVVAGPRAALGRREIMLREVNWLGESPIPSAGARLAVKLRSAQPPVAATVSPDGRVLPDAPAEAVAPGQACVFYDGERVLGGGWIARATAPMLHAALAYGGVAQR